jgi:hypothetical protein
MESFIQQLLMVLPAIRVDLFTTRAKPDNPKKNNNSSANLEEVTVFELTVKKENIKAIAILEDGDFVVQKGSLARKDFIGKRTEKVHYWKDYDKLVEQGILLDNGNHKVFTKNYSFSSVSAAGSNTKLCLRG